MTNRDEIVRRRAAAIMADPSFAIAGVGELHSRNAIRLIFAAVAEIDVFVARTSDDLDIIRGRAMRWDNQRENAKGNRKRNEEKAFIEKCSVTHPAAPLQPWLRERRATVSTAIQLDQIAPN
jgi:hypothetical protein